ncbi:MULTISPECIES: DUF4189 domain-containing protein [unclassified Lysobacter]|uniref:DUF4189 domain-containing protein n=1 Tax=unclassified Lysobacter TaxID=2635362 RepID=UPI001BE67E3D|nr:MULTISPECIES: DUF4189 domain-containing protein [unclassified Lysobacter]MBT2746771.1 DUF4189 domain-containing protein [Lysobacter sp. ISL-42]MBT2751820.1 DUF4189 domain-containing protein [Lysobacter sp. ISL-50]MBT2778172.1 DUF4189 domain-containing protein [Lysobacter sp. ISL-54]MBT2781813.1 DUF4189 domain-containing protein [Lysobacter sp. ISL-52]
MSTKSNWLFVCALLLNSGAALAEQGCPDGFIPNPAPTGTPGQNQCIQGQMPSYGPVESQQPTGPRWAKRWGAFTSDSVTSKVGVSSGAASKRTAEKEAVQDCKRRGGSKCEVILAFNNQCGAIAWGERPGAKGVLSAVSAASDDQAKAGALKECSLKSNECEIFLSECSQAELVQ